MLSAIQKQCKETIFVFSIVYKSFYKLVIFIYLETMERKYYLRVIITNSNNSNNKAEVFTVH